MSPTASAANGQLGAYSFTGHTITSVDIRIFAGLDIGQKQDFTALAIVERHDITFAERNPVTWEFLTGREYVVSHLERLPLGTPYPDIVNRVRWTLQEVSGFSSPNLIVDATGVGAPVVDLFKTTDLRRALTPVTITGGHSETRHAGGGFGVPKRDLITGLQVAFESRDLSLASGMGEAVETLIRELMAMRAEVTAHGNERFGVWREGMHDDLVLATALAWWGARRKQHPEVWGRRPILNV